MKKLYASLLTCLLLTAAALSTQAQTIRRVNNSGITGTNIYSTAQAAHDAATAGDIIQLEPSSDSYGNLNITKNVSVVGPGYFLGQNTGLQANPLSATISTLYFSSGSAGASVAGLTISSQAYIGASNVSLQRCYVASWIYVGYATSSNINIRQNYAGGLQHWGNAANNVLVTNNMFTSSSSLGANVAGEAVNNVFLSAVNIDNFNVRNNYFAGAFQPNNNLYSYNISAQAGFSTANSNQNNVPQASVFTLAPGTTQFDAWYQLKAGTNPARGTGSGGTDIGAFGGNTPYKLSGIPAIPSIYQFNQTLSGNTLNVNLSTRSNN
ncbi:hypothetical protein EJV47_13420 [Hymenobacter gummosus]|uniref:Right-handed parallel beta-helix repeat-containing protein n=1 Tax=Hymenobacter gummosus TaxID=1776032 RepID=A0A3S0JDK3_9BACT|nr:hypothetical protein [Hymenobacter gummosus]RTQ49143.1 hypothetical protein EJV47_13420 [Hymenobacter gummosus]